MGVWGSQELPLRGSCREATEGARPSGQFGRNTVYDSVKITKDFVVPEAENAVALGSQFLISGFITFLSLSVLTAVKLDGKTLRDACEVDHIPTNRMLTSEPTPGDLATSESTPEKHLRIGGVCAQLPGEFDLLSWRVLAIAFRHG